MLSLGWDSSCVPPEARARRLFQNNRERAKSSPHGGWTADTGRFLTFSSFSLNVSLQHFRDSEERRDERDWESAAGKCLSHSRVQGACHGLCIIAVGMQEPGTDDAAAARAILGSRLPAQVPQRTSGWTCVCRGCAPGETTPRDSAHTGWLHIRPSPAGRRQQVCGEGRGACPFTTKEDWHVTRGRCLAS